MNSLDVNLLSFGFTLLVSIVSFTLTISNTKHNQDTKIAAVRSEFKAKLDELNYKQQLLEEKNKNAHEKFEYLYNAMKQALEHKTNRLARQIIDINNYLKKSGDFIVRSPFNSSEE